MNKEEYQKIKKKCFRISKNYRLNEEESEDFLQNYLLMLLEKKWKQHPFYTLVDYFRIELGVNGQKKNVRNPYSLYNKEGNVIADKNLSYMDDQFYELRSAIKNIFNKLTAKEKYIFYKYYINGFYQDDIAKCLEITESRVCQILTEIKERIRNEK